MALVQQPTLPGPRSTVPVASTVPVTQKSRGMSLPKHTCVLVLSALASVLAFGAGLDAPVDRDVDGHPRLGKNTVARLERIEEAKLALAREELTAIGTLAEEYSEHAGKYPGSPGGLNELQVKLEGVFNESELQKIPRSDPWGQAYQYWTDGKRYFVATYGPNQRPAVDYSRFANPRANWADLCSQGDDLVFENGSLCR